MRHANSAYTAARRLKASGVEPTPDAVIKALVEDILDVDTPAGREQHRRAMLQRGGYASDDDIHELVRHSIPAVLHEWLAATCGVVVHVDDPQLVSALARTDVDAMISDVKLPFPIMEFQFPDESPANGCLVIDVSDPIVVKMKQDTMKRVFGYDYKNPYGDRIEVHSSINPEQAVYLSFDRNTPLTSENGMDLGCPGDLDRLRDVTRVAMACLLYAQTAHEVISSVGQQRLQQGVPSSFARVARKRKVVCIADLYGKSTPSCTIDHDPTASVKTGHWRRGHMRALRAERFERNKDGSVKVVWVRPCQIHPEQSARTERAIR